jgi:hypothetical protein
MESRNIVRIRLARRFDILSGQLLRSESGNGEGLG